MTFSNTQVDLESLPSIEDIQYTELDGRYAWLVLGVVVGIETLVGVAAIIWVLPLAAESGLASVIVITMLVLFLALALYRFYATRAIGYAVRDQDVLLRYGIFWQREVIQPSRRIQHVELARGPLETQLGLATLRLFSAGTGKATFAIPGLSLRTAVRTRRFVLETARRNS